MTKLLFDGTYIHDAEGARFLAVCADKGKDLGPLFAAAPDLLAALKGVLGLLELLNAPGTNDPIEARVYQARAAIAKATKS